jgi:hypothetical protein
MTTSVIVVPVLLLTGILPIGPHSANSGDLPRAAPVVLLLVLVILTLMGRTEQSSYRDA